MRRRASEMSENEKVGEASAKEQDNARGDLNQDDSSNDVAGEEGERTEDETANRDEEEEDTHEPSGQDILLIREMNMGLSGLLSLHYPARDVRIPVDGDCAMRMLTMFKTRTDARWHDDLDPRWSSAASGWVVLDLEQLLAMSYYPQRPQGDRTALDPH